jgi:hypothetical protein
MEAVPSSKTTTIDKRSQSFSRSGIFEQQNRIAILIYSTVSIYQSIDSTIRVGTIRSDTYNTITTKVSRVDSLYILQALQQQQEQQEAPSLCTYTHSYTRTVHSSTYWIYSRLKAPLFKSCPTTTIRAWVMPFGNVAMLPRNQ